MNIFSEFDIYETKQIRKVIINNIIATDMANHFNDLKKFKEIAESENNDLTKQENKEFICTQVIHLADISNTFKTFYISRTWVYLLFKEFYDQVNNIKNLFYLNQGDKEKELGLPVSILCDRQTTKIPEAQIFFYDFFLKDIISTFIIKFPKLELMKNIAEKNKEEWNELKNKPYFLQGESFK